MEQITSTLPLVALRGLTVVPGMIMHFDLNRDMSKKAVEQALNTTQKVLLVPQLDPEEENPNKDGLYKVCTVANIRQVTKLPNDIDRVMVEAVARAHILALEDNEGQYFSAAYEVIDDDEAELLQSEKEALVRTLKEVFDTYVRFYPKIGKSLGKYFQEDCDLEMLINQILINTPFTYEQKQQILEIEDIAEQCGELVILIMNEAQIAAIRTQLAVKIRERIDKNQKDYILREQLEYIQEELGDKNQYSDVKHYEEALVKLKADAEVKEKIKEIYHNHNGVDGYRSMAAYLERGGYNYSQTTIHKYMNGELGLHSIVRPKKPGTKPGKPHKVFDNKLNQDFHADKPNQKWCTDFTYLFLRNGDVRYNCAIIDLYDRSVVASVTDKHITSDLAVRTLQKALDSQHLTKGGLLLHSDQGSQYTSKAFIEYCESVHVAQSMSKAGYPYDNAPMERYFNTLKNECTKLYEFRTDEELYQVVEEFAYVTYSHVRPHSYNGYRTPYQARTAA